jgi:hypothetical protein
MIETLKRVFIVGKPRFELDDYSLDNETQVKLKIYTRLSVLHRCELMVNKTRLQHSIANLRQDLYFFAFLALDAAFFGRPAFRPPFLVTFPAFVGDFASLATSSAFSSAAAGAAAASGFLALVLTILMIQKLNNF